MTISNILLVSFFVSLGCTNGSSQILGGAEYIQNYAKLMTKKGNGPDLVGSAYLNERHHQMEVKLKDGLILLQDARLNPQKSSIDLYAKT